MSNKAKSMNFNKEMQEIMSDMDDLNTANNKVFREAIIEIVKALFEYCADLQKKHCEDIKEIGKALQKRFKYMDEQITRASKLEKSFKNLQMFLFLHAPKADYVFKKLLETGLIRINGKELWHDMWNDDLVSLLGFDCTAEELRQQWIDELKEPEDELGAVTGFEGRKEKAMNSAIAEI